MKTIKFIREDYRNGKLIKRQVVRTWRDFKPSSTLTIVWNFYEGFCTAFGKDYRRPIDLFRDGFQLWSYNFHKDQTGFIYRFVNGKYQTIKGK